LIIRYGGGSWDGRFKAFFRYVFVGDALASEFVGSGVLDVLGDGLVIFALDIGLFLKIL
jgi:hypothetical protein